MSGRFWSLRSLGFFLFLSLLISCARPNYRSPGESTSGPQNKEGFSCSLRFAKLNRCLQWQWIQYPHENQLGSLIFRVYQQDPRDGFPLPVDVNQSVAVRLWMPSMGHGSSPITVEPTGPGVFQANEVSFVMKGEWDFHFEMREGENLVDEIVVSLTY